MRLFLLFVCMMACPLAHGMEPLHLEVKKQIEDFVLLPSDCYAQRTVAMLSLSNLLCLMIMNF